MEVKLEQGSQEWLEYRKDKFNASETPILYGRGFTSVDNLAKEKLGLKPNYLSTLMQKTNLSPREKSIIFAVQKGQITENTIRNHINEKYNMNFEPIVFLDDNDDRFSASLDGFDKNNDCILEIKVSFKTYLKTMKNKVIPQEYIFQCYHQLMVSKASKLLFVAGYIDDNFELQLASAILTPRADIFADIIAKWNNFESKFLKCF